ncbi:amidohydrolase [Citrobacter werkmanii]
MMGKLGLCFNTPPPAMRNVALAAILIGISFLAHSQDKADVILYNGKLITMDEQQLNAQALAVKGRHIIAVGNNETVKKWSGPNTKEINLTGQTVIPGLIDAHLHGIRGGRTFLFETYWFDTKNLPDALNKLSQSAAKKDAEQWVAVAGSWIPEQFAEKRDPTVQELNQALPHHPAYIQSLYDYALLNQKAIETLKLNSPQPDVPAGIVIERDDKGLATGKLRGTIGSFNQLFAQISQTGDVEKNLNAFVRYLNKRGVVGFIDPSAGHEQAYRDFFKLQQQQPLRIRVGYRLSAPPGNETEWFKQRLAFRPAMHDDGRIAFLGFGESLVMAMNDGVRMSSGFTSPAESQQEQLKVLQLAAKEGVAVEIHAYTDDSADAILDVISEVAKSHDIAPLRWSIAHLNTGTPETIARMKKLGLAYSVQMGPYFESPAIERANGKTVAALSSPVQPALEQGVIVAGGTDATRIGVAGVWHAIEYHVTGKALDGSVRHDTRQLSREEALKMYTRNAAWLAFAEQQRGSLQAGKLADFAVLNQDIMAIAPDKLHQTESLLTFVDGQQVYPEQ